ncbi:MAG: hypothetical protein QOF40_190 [Actinomycetota bacterium]|nr:hypothetical protein [Actinomycetota bacterium]
MSTKHLLHSSGIPRIARESHLAALRWQARIRSRNHPARSLDAGRRLRILGFCPSYLPTSQAGSEVTLHRVLRDLRDRGHEVRVMVDGHAETATVDEIQVVAGDARATRRAMFEWCDVVIAQLGARGPALRLAAQFDRPLVFYMQIGNTPQHILWGAPDLTIFSSDYVRREFAWIERAIVVHPPIDEVDYLTPRGDAVTLINLSRLKGGQLLPELAERLPDHRFIGVRGWGAQLVPSTTPSNLTILGHQADMRTVYGMTRVLLVPSIYESYGRVGLEAAVSGIPSIAHPSGGVREALGDAALWADRNDLDAWVDAIKTLDDAAVYETYSKRARRRFEQLDPGNELDRLHDDVCSLARTRA